MFESMTIEAARVGQRQLLAGASALAAMLPARITWRERLAARVAGRRVSVLAEVRPAHPMPASTMPAAAY